MRIRVITLALTCVTASAVVASSPVSVQRVVPTKVMTYRDWAVGCDNGLSCQAVALMPEGLPEGSLSIVTIRSQGTNGAFGIDMSGASSKSDRFRILIDGKVADTGSVQVGSETIKVTGADAMKLARAMAKGKKLRLIDAAGTELGAASLAGSAAAFRYADTAQGRAGSRGAIIATGSKKATAKTAALPVIIAKKIKPTNILPDTTTLVAFSEASPCAAERFGPTEDLAFSLGSGSNGPQALVLLNCGSGAYNLSSGIYTGTRDSNGKWAFQPPKFDYDTAGLSEDKKIHILVNADWDEATQTISSYAKGRGVGDCGSSESFVWDGDMFRLTSATAMDECRGSIDWIPVWRAEVRLTD